MKVLASDRAVLVFHSYVMCVCICVLVVGVQTCFWPTHLLNLAALVLSTASRCLLPVRLRRMNGALQATR